MKFRHVKAVGLVLLALFGLSGAVNAQTQAAPGTLGSASGSYLFGNSVNT
jgi:hypothetical protein